MSAKFPPSSLHVVGYTAAAAHAYIGTDALREDFGQLMQRRFYSRIEFTINFLPLHAQPPDSLVVARRVLAVVACLPLMYRVDSRMMDSRTWMDRVAERSARLDALLSEVPHMERRQHLGRLPAPVRIELLARTAQLRLTMGFTSVEARNATSRWLLQLTDAERAKELLANGGFSEANAEDYALQREEMIEKLVHERAERDPESNELRLRRRPRGLVNRCAPCPWGCTVSHILSLPFPPCLTREKLRQEIIAWNKDHRSLRQRDPLHLAISGTPMDLLWRISTAVVDERLAKANGIRAQPRFELGVVGLHHILPCEIPLSTPSSVLYGRLMDCSLRDSQHATRYFRHRTSVRQAAEAGVCEEEAGDVPQPWEEEEEAWAETGPQWEPTWDEEWDEELMFALEMEME